MRNGPWLQVLLLFAPCLARQRVWAAFERPGEGFHLRTEWLDLCKCLVASFTRLKEGNAYVLV